MKLSSKYINQESQKNNIPCFGILGSLILNFQTDKKAIHKPSAQHVLDENYYKRIEAIQYTMTHDDGNKTDEFHETDIICWCKQNKQNANFDLFS